mgnify:CR=1 FL=1
MELSYNQLKHLLYRYPKFDLCYETASQKSDLQNYTLCLAVPTGKKHILWNTFYNDKDISYLFELNREKQVSKGTIVEKYTINEMSQNTIVYGTIVEREESELPVFVIDDVYFYKGIQIKNIPFVNKLSYMKEYVTYMNKFKHKYIFALPYIWYYDNSKSIELPYYIEEQVKESIGYEIHHLQYRSPTLVVPYVNVLNNKKINAPISTDADAYLLTYYKSLYKMDTNRPQYKYNTTFLVKADLQNDIYHLFAFGAKKKMMYYNIMFIPDYKTSVMMNNIFRKIKENKNLDYIEESDDEDDFQNIDIAKYVDIHKIVPFECKYSRKFKRWYPLHQVDENNKIVHIGKLVKNYINL